MRRSTSPNFAAANNPAYSDSWTAEQTTGIWVEWQEIIDEGQRVVSVTGGGCTGEVVV